jgi:hypothetical protein
MMRIHDVILLPIYQLSSWPALSYRLTSFDFTYRLTSFDFTYRLTSFDFTYRLHAATYYLISFL